MFKQIQDSEGYRRLNVGWKGKKVEDAWANNTLL